MSCQCPRCPQCGTNLHQGRAAFVEFTNDGLTYHSSFSCFACARDMFDVLAEGIEKFRQSEQAGS